MRLLRAKTARKTMAFYRVAFDLKPPFKVLLDGNFIHHALATVKTPILPRLKRLLGKGSVRLYAPRAVATELRALGEPFAAAVAFCDEHCTLVGPGDATPAAAILQLADGGDYVVATQDKTLQKALRKLPGVALAHFKNTVLSLDAPSKASQRAAAKAERERERPDEREAALAKALRTKQKSQEGDAVAPPQRKLKKRASGPNPLSCLKSSKKRRAPADASAHGDGDGDTTKRQRRRRKGTTASSSQRVTDAATA